MPFGRLTGNLTQGIVTEFFTILPFSTSRWTQNAEVLRNATSTALSGKVRPRTSALYKLNVEATVRAEI